MAKMDEPKRRTGLKKGHVADMALYKPFRTRYIVQEWRGEIHCPETGLDLPGRWVKHAGPFGRPDAEFVIRKALDTDPLAHYKFRIVSVDPD